MRIDDSNYLTIKNVLDITLVDYDIKWYDAENHEGYIEEDSILSMLDDLMTEVHKKEEELEDLKQEIEDNYELKKIDPYEEYGVSKYDFF